jgi:transcriptional regulator with GAF, ATPase, and Fis domain
LIQRALQTVHPQLEAHPLLVEACLLRAWPGNVRELIAEVRTAGQAALAEEVLSVEAHHLLDDAGRRFTPEITTTGSNRKSREQPSREEIEAVLKAQAGNVSSSARALGLHRTQLRRLLNRHDIDPKTFA